jgi:hypothetical protein
MTKQISIEKDIYLKLEARGKEKNLSAQEYICQLIHENTGFLPVTVQVPENIMRMLVAEGFFHMDRDEWFINAAIMPLLMRRRRTRSSTHIIPFLFH